MRSCPSRGSNSSHVVSGIVTDRSDSMRAEPPYDTGDGNNTFRLLASAGAANTYTYPGADGRTTNRNRSEFLSWTEAVESGRRSLVRSSSSSPRPTVVVGSLGKGGVVRGARPV